MKYHPPAGQPADAPYIDGNRNAGTKGSIVPAAAIEAPMRELVHLISFAGLTPNESDRQQVRKAIEALIAAATGGGDTSQYLLVEQARARLPIFPEILSADGRMNISSPAAGTVQVPTSVEFMHRGIFPVSTSDYLENDRTFGTAANKTYHLRWSPTDGFALKDLADAVYNPDVKPETDREFDSNYDDMLIARVVTNSSNVATITNLANLSRPYRASKFIAAELGNHIFDNTLVGSGMTLNWSRTPDDAQFAIQFVQAHGINVEQDIGHDLRKFGFLNRIIPTRYRIPDLAYRYQDSDGSGGHMTGTLSATAV